MVDATKPQVRGTFLYRRVTVLMVIGLWSHTVLCIFVLLQPPVQVEQRTEDDDEEESGSGSEEGSTEEETDEEGETDEEESDSDEDVCAACCMHRILALTAHAIMMFMGPAFQSRSKRKSVLRVRNSRCCTVWIRALGR